MPHIAEFKGNQKPNAKVNGRPLGRAQEKRSIGVPVERQVRPWRGVTGAMSQLGLAVNLMANSTTGPLDMFATIVPPLGGFANGSSSMANTICA